MSDENLSKFTLTEHINELKIRIIKVIICFLISTCIAMYFANDLYDFLAKPLIGAMNIQNNNFQRKLIFTGITEAFMTHMRLSICVGLGVSLPYIMFQLYSFLLPGLYSKEKKIIISFLISSLFLTIIGFSIAYYIVAPIACKFFIGFESLIRYNHHDIPIVLEARVSEYLSTIIHLILVFGIVFQLPIIIVMLSKLNIINLEMLQKYRRHAIVINFIVAAIITPPDIISQISLAIPMVLLYELSILLVRKL